MRSKIEDDGSWLRHSVHDDWRAEAFLSRFQFSTHAHDRYAIGITMHGVQQFDYRGATRNSLPGQVVVLHPDELHDGRAGTENGFCYRALYLEPWIVQNLSGMGYLPYIAEGVSQDPILVSQVQHLLGDISTPLDDLEAQSKISDLVDAMYLVAGAPQAERVIDRNRLGQVAAYLCEHFRDDVHLETLEQISGISRWRLCKDFRLCFGTSPHRFLIMRRLEQAVKLLNAGQPGARVAAMVGFADQSHFIRHFRNTYGLTPSAWRELHGRTNVLFFD